MSISSFVHMKNSEMEAIVGSTEGCTTLTITSPKNSNNRVSIFCTDEQLAAIGHAISEHLEKVKHHERPDEQRIIHDAEHEPRYRTDYEKLREVGMSVNDFI